MVVPRFPSLWGVRWGRRILINSHICTNLSFRLRHTAFRSRRQVSIDLCPGGGVGIDLLSSQLGIVLLGRFFDDVCCTCIIAIYRRLILGGCFFWLISNYFSFTHLFWSMSHVTLGVLGGYVNSIPRDTNQRRNRMFGFCSFF